MPCACFSRNRARRSHRPGCRARSTGPSHLPAQGSARSVQGAVANCLPSPRGSVWRSRSGRDLRLFWPASRRVARTERSVIRIILLRDTSCPCSPRDAIVVSVATCVHRRQPTGLWHRPEEIRWNDRGGAIAQRSRTAAPTFWRWAWCVAEYIVNLKRQQTKLIINDAFG